MPATGDGGKPSRPADADITLFREAARDVTPLPAINRAPLRRPLPRPLPQRRWQDDAQVLPDALADPWDASEHGDNGETLFFARPGLPHAALRKLKRGAWVVRAQLDLHGLRSDEARLALVEFLHRCARQDHRCVRIIHGKGLSSPNREPVLKHKLRHWLMQRADVLAFCQARPADGGAGAVIVLLKSAPH